MILDRNPFSNNRREGEVKSSIFVHYDDAIDWFENSNVIFEGHRGSGKTSILQAFNYENVWLKETIIEPDKKLKSIYNTPQFIGIMYRCEEHDTQSWDRWVKYNNIENGQHIYLTYLNYYFVEQLIISIKEIRKDSSVFHSKDSEYLFVEDVLKKAFLIEQRPNIPEYSLEYLSDILNGIHNIIRTSIINRVSWDILKEKINLHENCSLIIEVSKLITEHFKFCHNLSFFALIDDINRLNTWQVQCINTMIACYRAPLSFKVSCVYGLYKTKQTIDPIRPIANSDVKTIYLGYKDKTKISEDKYIDKLLELVFNSRIKSVYPKFTDIELENVFGKDCDQEKMLLDILEKSEKREVKDFLDNFKLSKTRYISDYWIKANGIVTEDNLHNDNLQKRKNDTDLKKYRVTARFSILNE